MVQSPAHKIDSLKVIIIYYFGKLRKTFISKLQLIECHFMKKKHDFQQFKILTYCTYSNSVRVDH